MRYFREQGKSDHEVIEALNTKFGDSYQIMTRKTVKLGGIFGVGRRTGVEYFGYIKEKAISIAGSRRAQQFSQRPRVAQSLVSGMKRRTSTGEEIATNPREQSQRDQRNREEILLRFAKNKEVQRLLHEKKLLPDTGGTEAEEMGNALPPAPHLTEQGEGRSPGGNPEGVYLEGIAQNSLQMSESPEKNHLGSSVGNPAPVPAAPQPEYTSHNYERYTGGYLPEEKQESSYASINYDVLAMRQPGSGSPQGTGNQAGFPGKPSLNPANNPNSWGIVADQGEARSNWPTHPPEGPRTPPGTQSKNIARYNFSGYPPTEDYSSDSGSTYQRNLDQVEATFLHRLESLERKMDRRSSMNEPHSLGELRTGMYHNEFPPSFVDRLVSQIKRELPLDQLEKLELLWEYVLLHIAENMHFLDVQKQVHSRIMVLVGPTGVGKTTTIAKLAARQCVEAMGGSKKVHLITLDNYRIGAQDQIRTYGEILGTKVDCVETTEGLATCIAQDQESDMILIDTMGRSPGDHMKLAEMRRFLEHSGDCEIHLAMSATSGVSAMKEIITQFKPFGFRSVILTKLDELGRIGGSLATFLQEEISLSYLTTGQKVPQDIRQASALALFQQLVDVQVPWESFAQKLEENML